MKIKLLSDLHLEFSPFQLPYSGEDILILAGDISPNMKTTVEFISKHLLQYPSLKILYVLGNHDYYGRSISKTHKFWESVNIDRFFYLQNTSIVIDGIRFFGTTLWTDMNNYDLKTISAASEYINDYRYIKKPNYKKITPTDTYIIHNESKIALIKCLDESVEPVAIISHHLPSYKSIAEKYKNFPATGTFASHLDDIVKRAIVYFHGHTHTSFDYFIDKTRVVCNPRGYCKGNNNENTNFNPNLTIEISP